MSKGADWKQKLTEFMESYMTTVNLVTGRAPADLFFGRRIRNKFPLIVDYDNDDDLRDKEALAKESGKEYVDKRRGAKESNIGDIGDNW